MERQDGLELGAFVLLEDQQPIRKPDDRRVHAGTRNSGPHPGKEIDALFNNSTTGIAIAVPAASLPWRTGDVRGKMGAWPVVG
jgi:hypothetical protein